MSRRTGKIRIRACLVIIPNNVEMNNNEARNGNILTKVFKAALLFLNTDWRGSRGEWEGKMVVVKCKKVHIKLRVQMWGFTLVISFPAHSYFCYVTSDQKFLQMNDSPSTRNRLTPVLMIVSKHFMLQAFPIWRWISFSFIIIIMIIVYLFYMILRFGPDKHCKWATLGFGKLSWQSSLFYKYFYCAKEQNGLL